MNTVQSDMNQKVTDIFVLTARETGVPLVTGHLKMKGYRITPYSDGTSLLETLRTGKPNLLIADATTLDKEAFEVCHHIKSDDDLWVIPVLILTNASTLSDILQVLDCNADNFLPLPFDLPAGLSIIESMLATPVERLEPDQIKTQYKINLDDRIYRVAANRRKLLELLLSSFEIAVNKSSELSHTKTELQTLSESVMYLEERVTDQNRLIDTIKATIRQKEQTISTLTHEIGEKEKLLAQKTRKAHIVTGDDNNRVLPTSSGFEINSLMQRISELSNDLSAAKTSLETVQAELEEEKIHHTSLECTLELLGQQKEYLEKTLRSVTEEHEQLTSAFETERNRAASAEQELNAVIQQKEYLKKTLRSVTEEHEQLTSAFEIERNRAASAEQELNAVIQQKEYLEKTLRPVTEEHEQLTSALEIERNRAASAEQELNAVIQAKKQSEQELSLIINDFREARNQEVENFNRLKTELEREADRRISAENQLGTLRQDKEQSESFLRSSVTALKDQIEELRRELGITCTALENEENATRSLKENLAEIIAEQEEARIRVQEEREPEKAAFINQKRHPDETTATVKLPGKNLNSLEIQNKALITELSPANQKKPRSDQPVRMYSDELKKVQMVYGTGRSLFPSGHKSIGTLAVIAKETEQDIRIPIDGDPARGLLHENVSVPQGKARDKPKATVSKRHPEQQPCSMADEHSVVRKKISFREEPAGVSPEKEQDKLAVEPCCPHVTEESPVQAPVMMTIPDAQKSPVSQDEPISPKSAMPVIEVSREAVTDIVDIFSDDDSIEEEELT